MSQPYVGEIKMFAFSRTINGWAPCDGRLLDIAGHDTLFTLIGTTYGGDGQTTFALPDLRGRRPVHWGQYPGAAPVTVGQRGGAETHTLVATEMPAHTHPVRAAATATVASPANAVWGPAPADYGTTAGAVLAVACVTAAVGGQPHDNMPPFLVVNFQISLVGIYPTAD